MLHWVETGWSKLRASSMVTHWIIYDSHRGEVTYWINFTMCKVGKTKTAVDTLDLKVQRFTLGRKIVKTKWPTYSNWPCSMYVHGSHSPVPYDALFSAHLGLRKCFAGLSAWCLVLVQHTSCLHTGCSFCPSYRQAKKNKNNLLGGDLPACLVLHILISKYYNNSTFTIATGIYGEDVTARWSSVWSHMLWLNTLFRSFFLSYISLLHDH